MKLGVVIERTNYYRLLAPVVDAALARGWEVVCLHDYAQPRTGAKGYEFPAVEVAPRFRNGAPRLATYQGNDTLVAAIGAAGVDAVVSLMPPPAAIEGKRPCPAKWIGLQYAGELLYHMHPPSARAIDLLGLYSGWWLEFGFTVLRGRQRTTPDDELESVIRRKAVVVGFPEVDQFGTIDPTDVRRRWGIPPGKPVVAFLPYPFRSNPRTQWSRWVYSPGRRAWKRMYLRLSGQERLASMVARGGDDGAVCRAVRAFCDANGAHLLVKARLKDPVPRYLVRTADLTLNDQGHYPPTILEVLAVADICIHFYSGTVFEAAACGVPSLSICPALDDMVGATSVWHQLIYTREEGSLFQFRGVTATIGIDEAIEALPRMGLADFVVDPVAQEAYARKFLGFHDGCSSARLLDATRQLVEASR
jgi:hypothetical protein